MADLRALRRYSTKRKVKKGAPKARTPHVNNNVTVNVKVGTLAAELARHSAPIPRPG